MSFSKIEFTNKQGEKLSGRIKMPIGDKPFAYAIFAHCFTCNKNLNAVRTISSALTQQGFAVLSFDFTGLGESEGDFADTNFSSNVQDLLAANDFMQERYQTPCVLVGHSLGGAAVLHAATVLDNVSAVATIGAPSDVQHVQHLIEESIEAIQENGIATVSIGGRQFAIKKQFVDDLQASSMKSVMTQLRKPVLVFHSPQDATVDIQHAAAIYEMARHPKSFISLDGADHLLSGKEDAVYVGQNIAAWSSRYIPKEQAEMPSTAHQTVVSLEGSEYTTEVVSRQHHLWADEPKSLGGHDLGPTPKEFLLSSLGACSAMTVRMYATRKEWDLQEVKVHLNFFREVEDGIASERIERQIEIKGKLDDKQRSRLLAIADKCPVHKTLSKGVTITTALR